MHAAFDGERVLVTNFNNDSVTLFSSADLLVIGHIQLASSSKPFGACSDGIDSWVVLQGPVQLLRI